MRERRFTASCAGLAAALQFALAALLLASAAAPAAAAEPAGAWTRPPANASFDYLLLGTFELAKNATPGVKLYAVDGFDTSAATVAAMRAAGLYPVCYISAGSYENWRPDADSFAPADLGSPLKGWAGERWLDVRSANVRAILAKRMQMCKDKGFLAVDPDNVDGYQNENGKGLTAADQLAYNRWLATTAHSLGLAVGLKNDLGQIPDLVSSFDFFVNEQCYEFDECSSYAPAAAAGKPVYNIEYDPKAFAKGCKAPQAGVDSILKELKLDSSKRQECSGPTTAGGGAAAPAAPPPKNAAGRRAPRVDGCAVGAALVAALCGWLASGP